MSSLVSKLRTFLVITLLMIAPFCLHAVCADDTTSIPSKDALNRARREYQSQAYEKKTQKWRDKLGASETRQAGYERLVLIQRQLANSISTAVGENAKMPKSLTCKHEGELASVNGPGGQSIISTPGSSLDLAWYLIYGENVFAIISFAAAYPTDDLGMIEVEGIQYGIHVLQISSQSQAQSVDDPLPELNGKTLRFALSGLSKPPEKVIVSEPRKMPVEGRLQRREFRMVEYLRLVSVHRILHQILGGRDVLGTADTELTIRHHGELSRTIDLPQRWAIPTGNPLVGALEWQLWRGKSALATIAISPVQTDESFGWFEIDGRKVFVSVPFVSGKRSGGAPLTELGGESIQSLFYTHTNIQE